MRFAIAIAVGLVSGESSVCDNSKRAYHDWNCCEGDGEAYCKAPDLDLGQLTSDVNKLAQKPKITIGETTSLIPIASDTFSADLLSDFDGRSGNTDFEYISKIKTMFTVGEVDKVTGKALTGWPDGNAAFLLDKDTVRVIYQSESYGNIYSTPTWPHVLKSGATFTGSKLHFVDYDRHKMADFLSNESPASDMVKGSGMVFDTMYNYWGEKVVPGGKWGTETRGPDGTLVTNKVWSVFDDAGDIGPNEQILRDGKSIAEFYLHSFCSSWLQQPEFYGPGKGFEDLVYIMSEEWSYCNTPEECDNSIGLSSIAVDVLTKTAYVAPALGRTGYEKIMPLATPNTKHVVLVAAGYNHGLEPAPLKIYVGVKGKNADGTLGDGFLARNGLAYGRLYGLTISLEQVTELGMEYENFANKNMFMQDYLKNQSAPTKFPCEFHPTSYRYNGTAVRVGDTEKHLWRKPEEFPTGRVFFNGDTKTEHPAVDPKSAKPRYCQAMTDDGGIMCFVFPSLELDLETDDLPHHLTAKAIRLTGAYDGALTLTTTAVYSDGQSAGARQSGTPGDTTRSYKTTAPDGMYWVKGSDADMLVVHEDSGATFGERKYALMMEDDEEGDPHLKAGYVLALAGGRYSNRALSGTSSGLRGSFSLATESEFSGTWDLTAMLLKKPDGSLYSPEELSQHRLTDVSVGVPLNEKRLQSVIQHRSESGGQVAATQADHGGQMFMWTPHLPMD